MKSNEQLSREIEQVKALGEKFGYGHLMTLASALWRNSLSESIKGGAFVPTCPSFIKEGFHDKGSTEMYDNIIKRHEQEKNKFRF